MCIECFQTGFTRVSVEFRSSNAVDIRNRYGAHFLVRGEWCSESERVLRPLRTYYMKIGTFCVYGTISGIFSATANSLETILNWSAVKKIFHRILPNIKTKTDENVYVVYDILLVILWMLIAKKREEVGFVKENHCSEAHLSLSLCCSV